MLTVNEIFFSIQGESTFAGEPCVFVRLTACDLRCSWCDTAYAFSEGKKQSVDEVLAAVRSYGCRLVEVTGGEPLLQEDVYPLMDRLIADGYTVLLETGGHRSIARVPHGVVRVMDIKCPGSGESDHVDWKNLDLLGKDDQVKFVLSDRTDYEYARDVMKQHCLNGTGPHVLFSPVHGVLNPRQLSEWVLEDHLPVRVQLQIHKYIWGANTRGV